jgi:hypothetical protein
MTRCAEKVRYRDRLAALIALSRVRRDGEHRAYRCLHCRGWHLTSQKQGER